MAVISYVNAKLSAHEFIGTAQNIGELVFVFVWHRICSDFTGNSAINYRRRRNGISYVEFADITTKKCEVELVEGLGKRKVVVAVDFDYERRKFAKRVTDAEFCRFLAERNRFEDSQGK